MNLTVPAAVAALESAFLDMLREGPAGFGAFESGARSVALASCAEAMSRALEARDRELAASRPAGLRVHSRRPRTLATMCGDVRFRRTVLLDGAGLTVYPLDEELDLPAGDRVSPAARSFLVICGADVPFVSVNLFFTSFAKQARRSRKGGFTGCANVFSPIPVTAWRGRPSAGPSACRTCRLS